MPYPNVPDKHEAEALITPERRGVDAGALFVVSDYLGTETWDPKFHETDEDMQRLGDVATEILERRG